MNLDQLIPQLKTYVSGCPQPIMREELRRSARRFFERSTAWRVDVYVGIGAGMDYANLKLPAATMQVSIIRAQLTDDKDPLSPAPAGLNWASTERGKPKFYSADRPGKIGFFPLPNDTHSCKVRVAVKPELGSPIIPDELGDMYGELIAEGAAASILSMPDSDWYNPKQSDFHRANADRGIVEARTKVDMGYSNTGGRVYGGQFI